MSIFRSYDKCKGILLFKWNQITVELWYCPRDYKIVEHAHNNEEIELMFLCGKTTFYRRMMPELIEECFTPRWYHFGKCFGVPAGWYHRFDVGSLPLIFINFAAWRHGVTPTSAAIDFQPIKQ